MTPGRPSWGQDAGNRADGREGRAGTGHGRLPCAPASARRERRPSYHCGQVGPGSRPRAGRRTKRLPRGGRRHRRRGQARGPSPRGPGRESESLIETTRHPWAARRDYYYFVCSLRSCSRCGQRCWNLPCKRGSASRPAPVRDPGQVPGAGFRGWEMGVAVMPAPREYSGAFLLSVWQK